MAMPIVLLADHLRRTQAAARVGIGARRLPEDGRAAPIPLYTSA